MHWHEDPRFWALMRRMSLHLEDFDGARIDTAQIVQAFDLRPGAAVLDLCCGIGRYSLAFAEQGFRVTGVDVTEAYVIEARERAASASLEIEFVQSDMREFVRPRGFDAAVNLWTAFGYFDDDADNRRVLRNVCESLRSGGAIVLELAGKEWTLAHYQRRDWFERDEMLQLQERQFAQHCSRMDNRWIYLVDGERHEFNFALWLYSARELELMLLDSGFASVEVYGGYDLRPYDGDAKRIVAIARKC